MSRNAAENPLADIDEWQDYKVDQILSAKRRLENGGDPSDEAAAAGDAKSPKKMKKAHEGKEAKGEEKEGKEGKALHSEDEMKEDPAFNPVNESKRKTEFRNYTNSARQKRVENFYYLQHTNQTYDFVERMEKKYLSKYTDPSSNEMPLIRMGIWEALEYLNKVVDDSDPDTNLTQIDHALQTAEAIREKWPGEEYDWFHVVGLIHDLGKIIAVKDDTLGLQGEPQWCAVGDTFPVGVPFSPSNVFHEYFATNPDQSDSRYNSGLGLYKKGCGLFNVKMCWGHDEYLYQVCVHNKAKLPLSALYMIRYHSFYPWHKEGAYTELTNDQDRENLVHVKEFNGFDLYSKSAGRPNVEELKPYYQRVIKKYFPDTLLW